MSAETLRGVRLTRPTPFGRLVHADGAQVGEKGTELSRDDPLARWRRSRSRTHLGAAAKNLRQLSESADRVVGWLEILGIVSAGAVEPDGGQSCVAGTDHVEVRTVTDMCRVGR